MTATILRANANALPLADESVDLIVTSPPYFALRSYQDRVECQRCYQLRRDDPGRNLREAWPDYDKHVETEHKPSHYAGQLGSEPTPAEFVDALIGVTRECVRVLKPSGSLWVNLGDKYSGYSGKNWGHGRDLAGERGDSRVPVAGPVSAPDMYGIPNKSLIGIPWRYALRCIDDLGLILRAEIIWAKPNGLPESVTDRVRRSHEQWFHFVRQPRYYSAVDEIREAHSDVSIKRAMPHRANPGRRPTDIYAGQNGQTLDLGQMNHPLGKLPGSVWEVPTQPLTVPAHLGVDHFAAFPMEWPRRIIRGWSPTAICAGCGFLLGSSYDSGMLGVRRPNNGRARQNRAREEARFEAEPVLQQDVLQPLECPTPEVDQIPPTHDPRLRGDLEAGSPDGTEERLPDGASVPDGGTPRPTAGFERGRAPQERGQDGQPDRESGTARQGRARQAPEASAEALRLSSLRRSHPDVRDTLSCPHCGSDRVRPSLILDPFGGTGTSSLVAHALGRHGISVDLSADYCRLARWRTTDEGEYARALQVDKPALQVDGQASLFELLEEGA